MLLTACYYFDMITYAHSKEIPKGCKSIVFNPRFVSTQHPQTGKTNRLCTIKLRRNEVKMNQRHFSCGELMKRINDMIEKQGNSKLQSYGITVSQFKMLVALHLIPDGSATLKELEKYFGVAQSTAAGIASRLEKKKLVSYFSDSEDKRVKHIQLTESGICICENVRECLVETERHLLSGLTPEEETQLHDLLQKVYDTMDS